MISANPLTSVTVPRGATLIWYSDPVRRSSRGVAAAPSWLEVSRSVDFHVAGGKLVFGINFTDSGPEIRMNCINNFFCFAVDGKTLTFAAPRAEISFGLTLVAGHVQFTDVSTTFSTGNSDGDSIAAGTAITDAMTQKINGDAGIRSAVNSALDTVVRMAGRLGFLGPSLSIDALTLSGNTMTIQPGCAEL